MTLRRSKLALVLTTALTLVASACGGGGSSAKSTGPDKSSLPACPVNALDKATKPVHIVFWHAMARANEDELKRLTERFNSEQHDVQVSLVNQTSYRDNFTKYRAGLTSGDLPDLVQLEDTTTQPMADTQSAVPVQSCIDAEHYDVSDYLPRVLDRWSLNGVRWAMPFNVSNPVFFYNKAAFRKAGLDPDTSPANLDDVRADAQKLKAAGYATPYGLKIQSWFLEQWLAKANELYANNGNGRKARATKVVFDNATGKKIFEWLSSMVTDKLAVTNPDQGPSEFDNLLAIGNGQVAMTIDSSATLGTIFQVLNSGQYKGVEIGVGAMPGPAGADSGGVLVGGAALYISRKSPPEKQAAAWRFAKFLTQPDVQAEWAAATGYIPVRKSATDQPAIQQQWAKNPGYKVAYDQLVSGPNTLATQGPALGDYQGVRDAIVNAETAMLTQGRAPDVSLADAAKAADDVLAAYNARIG
jgi:sn-glycerol 3-phosphate transport system substrate-binding protein